jgi:hypothetical protein
VSQAQDGEREESIMSERKLELNITYMGMGQVVLDGIDLAKYSSGFDIRARIGEPTTVTMIFPAITVSGELEANVKALLDQLPTDTEVVDVTTAADKARRYRRVFPDKG